MHPLDFAMEMELEGKEFYLKQAQALSGTPLEQLFRALADDEEKHYQFVRQMKESGLYEFEETTILTMADSIFAQPLAEGSPPPGSYLEIYEMAIEFEEKAIKLYQDLAAKASSSREREVLMKLAKEEEIHRTILWKLQELLRRPEEWYPYLDLG